MGPAQSNLRRTILQTYNFHGNLSIVNITAVSSTPAATPGRGAIHPLQKRNCELQP